MKVLIVSDAWYPQVNGVVRTLESTASYLRQMGHTVQIVGPVANRWCSFPAPSYPSIRLEFFARDRLSAIINSYQPDFIHISTEGPLGWAMRNLCMRRKLPFTTSYHTRFPEYLEARAPRPFRRLVRIFTYAGLRRFHMPSAAVMVSTPSIEQELHKRKFRRIVRWSRGVDTGLFKPWGKDIDSYRDLPRPIMLYVGRVAIEKNLRAFLSLKQTGSLVVIGDGPDMERLKADYPAARFLGAMSGERLARHYAAADLFVFPSTTDTFGLVLLEAAACGLRIASYPAPGPIDVLVGTEAFAVLDKDLSAAVDRALALPDNAEAAVAFAASHSWTACTAQFYNHLQSPTPKAVKRLVRVRNWLGRWANRAVERLMRERNSAKP